MDAFSAYKVGPGRDTLVALLEAQQDTVYNLCFQVLRHPENAQDAAQQVLMRLVDALPRIKDGPHLKQWLHRAAFHVSLDLKKVQKRRRERERRVAMTESTMPDDAADEVQRHVSQLDDELRTLVVEHYFEQRPLADLAGERGCSSVAVWKKLERAREQLRDSLTRAGFASLVPGLEPFFASLKPVAAPKGLLAKVMLPKAAGAVALAGIAMKIKMIAAAAILALGAAGALGVVVARQRDERRREIELKEEARARLRTPASAAKASTSSPTTPRTAPAAAAPEPEEVETFKTSQEFTEACRKAFAIKDDAARWKALRRIGFLRTPEQFRKVEDELRARPGTSEYEKAFIGGILKDWVATDFKGLVEFSMRIPTEPVQSRPEKLGLVLLGLAHWNRDAVMAYASSLSEEEGRSEVLAKLGSIMPPTKEAVLAMAPGRERTEALKRLLVYSAGKDPRAAARWIAELSDAGERAEARSALVNGWGRSDIPAAAAWIDENASGKERAGLLRDLIGGAMYTNPGGAFELAAKALEAKEVWCVESERAFKGWIDSDPASAARFMKGLPAPVRGRGSHWLSGLGKEYALRDPSAALDWAESLEGEERTQALMAVSEGLVKSIISNPKEALSVVDKLPASRREEALSGVVTAWADIDPRAAADFARSRPESAAKLDEAVAREWAKRDLGATIAWARSLPEGIERDSAVRAAALACAGQDVPRAADLAREIRDPGLRDQALNFVVRQLSGKDLQRSIAMATEIANPELRKSTQNDLLGRFGGTDPQACLEMLRGMQNATPAQYGIFAAAWAQTDPRSTLAWAEGLTRPEFSDLALRAAFIQWSTGEPNAARAWAESARLTDAQRGVLLKSIPARK